MLRLLAIATFLVAIALLTYGGMGYNGPIVPFFAFYVCIGAWASSTSRTPEGAIKGILLCVLGGFLVLYLFGGESVSWLRAMGWTVGVVIVFFFAMKFIQPRIDAYIQTT